MSRSELEELGDWCKSHVKVGNKQARVTLGLIEELANQRAMVLRLADRIYAAHEVLARRAEKKGVK